MDLVNALGCRLPLRVKLIMAEERKCGHRLCANLLKRSHKTFVGTRLALSSDIYELVLLGTLFGTFVFFRKDLSARAMGL